MDSQRANQQLAIPNNVIEKAIRLHQYFNQKIQLPHISRATAMIYFYRYYEKMPDLSPKEYALSSISCLHLATKVCEAPKSLSLLMRQLEDAQGDDKSILQDIFQTLDGISSRFSKEEIVQLIEKLTKKEMAIIVALNFDFAVVLPYNLIEGYISRILRWHLNPDSPNYQSFFHEILQKCSMFLNDLQLIYMFYIYEPEILAIAAINMTFDYLRIPLVSPPAHPWFLYLAPNLDQQYVLNIMEEVRQFFLDKFRKNRMPENDRRKTEVSDDEMKNWFHFPCMIFKNTPQCPPPPLQFLDSIVKDSDSFKHCELDHVPPFEPPPDLDYFGNNKPVNKEKKKETKEIPKNKEKEKEKGKKKEDLSRVNRRQYDDYDLRDYPERKRLPIYDDRDRYFDERLDRPRFRFDNDYNYDYDDRRLSRRYDLPPRYRLEERSPIPPPRSRERSPSLNEKMRRSIPVNSNYRSPSPRDRSPRIRSERDKRKSSPPRSRERIRSPIHISRSKDSLLDRSPPPYNSRDRSPRPINSRDRDRSPRPINPRDRDRSPLPPYSSRGRDRSPPPVLSDRDRNRDRLPPPMPRERDRYSPPMIYDDRPLIRERERELAWERERELREREREDYMRYHSKNSRKSGKESEKDKGKDRNSKSKSRR